MDIESMERLLLENRAEIRALSVKIDAMLLVLSENGQLVPDDVKEKEEEIVREESSKQIE